MLWRRARSRTVLRFRVSGVLEDEDGAARRWRAHPQTRTLLELLGDLKAAARDPSVEAVAVRIGRLDAGWAAVDEVRRAVRRLRDKGRRAYAYLEGGGHLEYFLATAFEHVVMPPMASLDVVGLRSEVTFYKGTLDLLGVTACFESAGEYKSFAEPFLRETMSDQFRESLDHVLGDLHRRFVAEVAAARADLDDAGVQALLDQGPWLAREAQDAGLIDRTLYPDRWPRAIRKEMGDLPPSAEVDADDDEGERPRGGDAAAKGPFAAGRRKLRFRKASRYLRPWRRIVTLERWASPKPKVAVVLASGPIEDIDDPETAPGVTGWRAVGKTLHALAEDRGYSAVVLRIDSPGGSGPASDLLWREIRRVAKKKPVVASMGNVAASGGYYLSMGADAIVASPMTITGSIGVVGGKFDVSGLLTKAGLRREVLSYGAHTGLFSMSEGLTESERERLRGHMVSFYDEFVGKAAEGRGVEPEELEPHARGRIWTGPQAHDLGLVDEVGDLQDAVDEAARRAGLPPGWETVLVTAPRPGFLRRLRARLPFASVRVEADWLQARLPYDLRIR